MITFHSSSRPDLPHNHHSPWSYSGHLGCGAFHPFGGCCHCNHSSHEEKGVMLKTLEWFEYEVLALSVCSFVN